MLVLDPRKESARPQDVEHPFVTLDESGVFSRVLLGRVQTESGRTVAVAVKIQKDVLSPPPVRGLGRSYTNRDAEAAFEREARCRESLAEDHEGIVPLARGVGTGARAASPLPIISLPITYCKKIEEFFHPVCPHCGGYLRDSRNEVQLAKAGLSSCVESALRFLCCPECGENPDATQTFYTVSTRQSVPPGGQTRVRVGRELYRDFQRLVRSREPGNVVREQQEPSLRQFPCTRCPHKEACYPLRADEARPIPAEEMLYPVVYHEFCAIIRELFELHYDEFAQFLGGRAGEEIRSRLAKRIPPGAFAERAAELDLPYAANSRYFWGNAPGERSALEVLWLKLAAFEQLGEGVRRIYEGCARPHLNLQPKSVMVSGGPPPVWSFRVGITNPAAASPVHVEDAKKDTESPGFLNRADYNRLFTSPLIRRLPYGHEEYVNVTFRGVRSAEAGLDIEVDLISEVIGVFQLTAKDRVKVTLNAPANKLDGLAFWATEADRVPAGYRVLGRARHMRPDVQEVLKSSVGQTLWDCRVNICRFYGAPCDVYSLGMMLLCSLLVNDAHDEAEVCRQVEEVGRELTSFAASAGKPGRSEIERKLSELLAERGSLFKPEAVFYRAADRQAGAGDLSEELWLACQKLGFAMTTEIDGFSPCAARGEIGTCDGPALVKNVLERLKNLNLWAEGRLFVRRALRRELAEALSY